MLMDNSTQLSDEWFAARCGVATASSFSKIVTATGKPSTQAQGYMNQLLADWYIGKQVDVMEASKWMERGTELEEQAREMYSFMEDSEVLQVGLCYLNDEKLIGASPDGLVGDSGLLEIKCPKASTVIDYMLNGFPSAYKQQVQGQLWVTGLEWCDFFVYHPDIEPLLIRVKRDQEYIDVMDDLIHKFIKKMMDKRKQLKEG